MGADEDAERVGNINEFFGAKAPGLLGFDLVESSAEVTVARTRVTEPLIAGNGFLFAPVVVSLADTTCASGIGHHIDFEAGESFTTVEMKANFMGTAREGETIEARARPVHVGRSTHVWDCEVVNLDRDKTIALFRCTQMVLRS